MASVLPICLFVVVLALTSAVPVDEQKPFDCPENEVYYKCHLEVCYKTCDHLVHPPPCPSIWSGCYKPACVCNNGYLRNSAGICVPEDKCS
uniref:TIL domain-containing protein n=1 Tax=Heliothis virescens TaxID=7102 RepID=A0A2A4J6R5_HELVI